MSSRRGVQAFPVSHVTQQEVVCRSIWRRLVRVQFELFSGWSVALRQSFSQLAVEFRAGARVASRGSRAIRRGAYWREQSATGRDGRRSRCGSQRSQHTLLVWATFSVQYERVLPGCLGEHPSRRFGPHLHSSQSSGERRGGEGHATISASWHSSPLTFEAFILSV